MNYDKLISEAENIQNETGLGENTASRVGGTLVKIVKWTNEPIPTARIADKAVTTGKLADKAVTNSKISAQAVTADKIAANAIITPLILNQAVNADKLASNAVTGAKIAPQAITADKLAPELTNSLLNKYRGRFEINQCLKEGVYMYAVTTPGIDRIHDNEYFNVQVFNVGGTITQIAHSNFIPDRIFSRIIEEKDSKYTYGKWSRVGQTNQILVQKVVEQFYDYILESEVDISGSKKGDRILGKFHEDESYSPAILVFNGEEYVTELRSEECYGMTVFDLDTGCLVEIGHKGLINRTKEHPVSVHFTSDSWNIREKTFTLNDGSLYLRWADGRSLVRKVAHFTGELTTEADTVVVSLEHLDSTQLGVYATKYENTPDMKVVPLVIMDPVKAELQWVVPGPLTHSVNKILGKPACIKFTSDSWSIDGNKLTLGNGYLHLTWADGTARTKKVQPGTYTCLSPGDALVVNYYETTIDQGPKPDCPVYSLSPGELALASDVAPIMIMDPTHGELQWTEAGPLTQRITQLENAVISTNKHIIRTKFVLPNWNTNISQNTVTINPDADFNTYFHVMYSDGGSQTYFLQTDTTYQVAEGYALYFNLGSSPVSGNLYRLEQKNPGEVNKNPNYVPLLQNIRTCFIIHDTAAESTLPSVASPAVSEPVYLFADWLETGAEDCGGFYSGTREMLKAIITACTSGTPVFFAGKRKESLKTLREFCIPMKASIYTSDTLYEEITGSDVFGSGVFSSGDVFGSGDIFGSTSEVYRVVLERPASELLNIQAMKYILDIDMTAGVVKIRSVEAETSSQAPDPVYLYGYTLDSGSDNWGGFYASTPEALNAIINACTVGTPVFYAGNPKEDTKTLQLSCELMKTSIQLQSSDPNTSHYSQYRVILERPASAFTTNRAQTYVLDIDTSSWTYRSTSYQGEKKWQTLTLKASDWQSDKTLTRSLIHIYNPRLTEIEFGLPVPTTRANATAVKNADIIVTTVSGSNITFSCEEIPTIDIQVALRY